MSHNIGKKHHNWKGGKPRCKDCDKKLSRRGVVKCWRCYQKFNKGKNHPQYKDGRTNKKYKCIDCEKSITRHTKTNRCRSCALKHLFKNPKNHPSYINGASFKRHSKNFSNSLKELTRNRDNRKCQLCGVPEIECRRKSDVHHIDYNKENNNFNNLVSLCAICHIHTNANRDYWQNYFESLISSKR